MSQLDEQFNTKGIFYLKTALAIFSGSGDPNSIEDGALGCLYIDEATGDLYQKTTAIGTLTGWTGGGGGGTPGGSDTEVQYNNAGAFGGIRGATSDGTSLFISALNLQADQPTFLNDVAFIKDAIGVVTDDGINLVNTTAAALGSQQFSPGIRWTGNGWKTSSGGASQAMDVIAQLETVQGAAVPTSNLCFSFQSNGTGYTKRFAFSNTGSLTIDQTLNSLSVVTQALTCNGAALVNVASATAFVVGPNGATNPTLSVVTNTASAATGLSVTSAAAGSGIALAALSSGSNESIFLTPKGTGQVLGPAGSSTSPAFSFSGATACGIYQYDVNTLGIKGNAPTIGIAIGQAQVRLGVSPIAWGSDFNNVDLAIIRNGAGVARISNSSTGTAQLIIGTSSQSAAAQLSVYSANSTRPAALFSSESGAATTVRIVNISNFSGTDLGGYTVGGALVQTNLGTAPSASVTDATLRYTKDVATGKAESFIRNEYGEITRVTACTRVLTEDFGVGSTTLADVTATSIYGALSFDVEASTPYRFRAFLRVAADAAGGFKVAINGTATATSVWYNIQAMGISAGSVINTLWTSLGSSSGTNGVIDYFVQIEGYILINAAGTLTVQFANNSATGTSLCKEGSSFTIAQGNR